MENARETVHRYLLSRIVSTFSEDFQEKMRDMFSREFNTIQIWDLMKRVEDAKECPSWIYNKGGFQPTDGCIKCKTPESESNYYNWWYAMRAVTFLDEII